MDLMDLKSPRRLRWAGDLAPRGARRAGDLGHRVGDGLLRGFQAAAAREGEEEEGQRGSRQAFFMVFHCFPWFLGAFQVVFNGFQLFSPLFSTSRGPAKALYVGDCCRGRVFQWLR